MDEFQNAIEVVPRRLYLVALRDPATSMRTSKIAQASICFNVDEELLYEPFFSDFGPLHLGHTFRFCELLNRLLSKAEERDIAVFHCCSAIPQYKTNAAVLMGAYQVLFLGVTPEQAWAPLQALKPFMPFRDASCGPPTFHLQVLDCLRGLHRAKSVGFLDWHLGPGRSRFDVNEYEYYESVENADLNWIVPNKLLGFGGPAAKKTEYYGYRTLVPEDYLDYFRSKGVTAVVRLNKKVYDRRKFTASGLHHYELYFPDGTCPTEPILRKFLEVAEAEPGALAVHCKAGLGRTGVLVCCFMMKHYGFTAEEAIGYIRVCRPGSVIGPQQNFIKDMQEWCWREGERFRARGGRFQVAAAAPVKVPGAPRVITPTPWPSIIPRDQSQPRPSLVSDFVEVYPPGIAGGPPQSSGNGASSMEGYPAGVSAAGGQAANRYAPEPAEVDLDQFISDREGVATSPMKPLRSGTKPTARAAASPLLVAADSVRASAPVGSGMQAARNRSEAGGAESPSAMMRSMPAFSPRPPPPRPAGSPTAPGFKRKVLAATLHTDTVGNAVARPRMSQDPARLHQTMEAGPSTPPPTSPWGRPSTTARTATAAPYRAQSKGPADAAAARPASTQHGSAAGGLSDRGRGLSVSNRSASVPRNALGGLGGPKALTAAPAVMAPRAANARPGAVSAARSPAGYGGEMSVAARTAPRAAFEAEDLAASFNPYRATSPGRGGAARIVTSTGQPRKVPAALVTLLQQQGAVAGMGMGSPVPAPALATQGRPGSAVRDGLLRAHSNGAEPVVPSPPASPPSRSPRPPSNPRGAGGGRGRTGGAPEIPVR